MARGAKVNLQPPPTYDELFHEVMALKQQVKNFEKYLLKGVAFRDELQAQIRELEEKNDRLERHSSEAYADRDRWQMIARERLDTIDEASKEPGAMKRLLMEPVYTHRIAELESQLCQVREALQIYANDAEWECDVVDIGVGNQPIPGTQHIFQFGPELAKAALSSSTPCRHAAIAERVQHCAECGGEWYDGGLNSRCYCVDVKKLRGAHEESVKQLEAVENSHAAIAERAEDTEGMEAVIYPLRYDNMPIPSGLEGVFRRDKCLQIVRGIQKFLKGEG